MSRAGVAASEASLTARVLQAEAGLVSLSHLAPRGEIQQVIMTEGVHAVEVPDGTVQSQVLHIDLIIGNLKKGMYNMIVDDK